MGGFNVTHTFFIGKAWVILHVETILWEIMAELAPKTVDV